MPPIYVLNLDRCPGRWAYMHGQLRRMGLEGTRIAAVDGLLAPLSLAAQFASSPLTPGEIGCYASHMLAWKALLASPHPYALILEDDAEIPSDLMQTIKDALRDLPATWDFLHLYGAPNRATVSVAPRCGLVRYSRAPSGTVAYLIHREGARKLLNPQPRRWPIDTDTRRPWVFGLDSYGLVPAPVKHSGRFVSALGNGGRSRRRRGWTLNNPLWSLAGLVWNLRKLGVRGWCGCALVNARRKLRRQAGWATPRSPGVGRAFS